ncbi:hypothetical protein SAMN06265173_13114 [Thalassovita litoralis]|jgi:hypothetical protein|uniref:Uncharacterized protein n=1 Tax=Thalassovita litoralis TaxID=1010611 RepID=A0A521FIS5_9RHOB|nr:hypothetical protein [Thalassovita litoralis]SMO96009.1 hypothetical protein SAMN06265173_13114 [Thalassovita litoralis]
MLEWLLFGIAAAAGSVGGLGSSGGQAPVQAAAATPAAPVQTAPDPRPAAEDQTPTGKFTTAAEIKPILTATKGQWIAVREYDGQDIIYFTQLLSWRCGLSAIRYSVNGGPMQVYPMPPCHMDMAQPNVFLDDEAMPIMGLPPKSVQTVDVEVFLDDTSVDFVSYQRNQVLIP